MTGVTWRLLRTAPAGGAYNMAVDEAVLDAVATGAAAPTLRLYSWEPPCLSLGRFQPLAEVDLAACAAAGVQVVRRPTGGSAILHDEELTYAIIAPESDPHLQGDVLASYNAIARVLAQAMKGLGVEVTLADIPAGPRGGAAGRGRPAPCFLRPAGHEILASGRKLIGSAQCRRGGAILQHGAIPLDGDVGAIAALLSGSASQKARAAEALRARAISLRQAAGRLVTLDATGNAIAASLAELWNIALREDGLTAAETARALRLADEKYAGTAWTDAETHSRTNGDT